MTTYVMDEVDAKGWTPWETPHMPLRTNGERFFRMRCCDCSLVHGVQFRIRAGKIQWRLKRDVRATAACRRQR